MAITDNPNDVSWLRQAFLLRPSDIDDIDRRQRTFSSAFQKYTDTTLGGNIVINSPPQFTRHADLKVSSIHSASKGMGRYYSEAIDDHGVNIHMRFGVAEYNSLTRFFANFYDTSTGVLARTGESTGILFNIGKVAGTLVAAPLIPFAIATRTIVRAVNFFLDKPYSKYYYSKPTMPLYWSAVNTLVNTMAVNMGLIAASSVDAYELDESGKAVRTEYSEGLTGAEISAFNRLLPDIFRSDGGIDIYSVANRAQRIANRRAVLQETLFENVTDESSLREAARQITEDDIGPFGSGSTLTEYIARYHSTTMAKGVDSDRERQDPIGSWESDFANFLSAEFSDGSQWVSFRVIPQRTVGESFQNQTGESEIASKINGMSSAARSARFSVLDGNLGDGLFAGAVETIIGGAKDLLAGAAEGVGLAGIAALGGSAFVDIPEHWQDSVAELPSESYTIELRAPYGNKMSIFTNVYVPLAMLLAAALPLSTGKQSYTSPFLVELFSKGRTQTRLGMIDSLSVTRGAGNIGWSVDQLPTGIDLNFTVKDLSSVMHMPISDDFGIFDDDSAFTDYMAVLGSLGLTDQVYPVQKLKRRISLVAQTFDRWTSPGFYAQHAAATLPGRVMTAIARGTGRG